MYPYSNPTLISKGLNFLKTIKWTEFLDGTQKTLGVINQAIPVIYQVKPIMNNAKTLFKIANIMKTQNQNNSIEDKNIVKKQNNNSPVFYI